MKREFIHITAEGSLPTVFSDGGTISSLEKSKKQKSPQEQTALLKNLFTALSQEGGYHVTNRRDAALDFMIHTVDEKPTLTPAIEPILKEHKKLAVTLYTNAIERQKGHEDAISGSVGALLTVGEAMDTARLIDTESAETIKTAWEIRGANASLEDSHVIFSVTERLDAAQYERAKTISHGQTLDHENGYAIIALDFKIKALRDQDKKFTNDAIATALGINLSRVKSAFERLTAAGLMGSSITKTENQIILDKQVQKLTEQGLPSKTIENMLGISKRTVSQARNRQKLKKMYTEYLLEEAQSVKKH